MSVASPFLNAGVELADLYSSFPKVLADAAGLWPDGSPDSAFDLLVPGLAGVAAAVAVAIALTVYFQTGYRSARDIVRHGLAAAAVLALLGFVAYDMRNAASAYLGIAPTGSAASFELRWLQETEATLDGTRTELARR